MSRGRPGGIHLDKAYSGARTELYRVIDLINQGHSPESIKAWAHKEIRRMRKVKSWQNASVTHPTKPPTSVQVPPRPHY